MSEEKKSENFVDLLSRIKSETDPLFDGFMDMAKKKGGGCVATRTVHYEKDEAGEVEVRIDLPFSVKGFESEAARKKKLDLVARVSFFEDGSIYVSVKKSGDVFSGGFKDYLSDFKRWFGWGVIDVRLIRKKTPQILEGISSELEKEGFFCGGDKTPSASPPPSAPLPLRKNSMWRKMAAECVGNRARPNEESEALRLAAKPIFDEMIDMATHMGARFSEKAIDDQNRRVVGGIYETGENPLDKGLKNPLVRVELNLSSLPSFSASVRDDRGCITRERYDLTDSGEESAALSLREKTPQIMRFIVKELVYSGKLKPPTNG